MKLKLRPGLFRYATGACFGSALLWLGLQWCGDINPIWAVISFIVVLEPHAENAWKSCRLRLLNTTLGSVLGLFSLLTIGTENWAMPLVVGVTAFIAMQVVEVAENWRVAPATAAIVFSAGLMKHSIEGGELLALQRTGEVFVGSVMAVIVAWIFSLVRSSKGNES